MPRPKKTWGEKMKAKPPHHVILENDFAGIPKGANELCKDHQSIKNSKTDLEQRALI